jgi:hypothetical protein
MMNVNVKDTLFESIDEGIFIPVQDDPKKKKKNKKKKNKTL